MSKGFIAYTFKWVVSGIQLLGRFWEAYWFADDSKRCATIHSIEVQIYRAACIAKVERIDSLIFVEVADAMYGRLRGLLLKVWWIDCVDGLTDVQKWLIWI